MNNMFTNSNFHNYGNSGNGYTPNYFLNKKNGYDDRFVGGFAFPFLLGGVTGAAIAPAFFGGYNRPYYNPYYGPYYRPYYGPYFR